MGIIFALFFGAGVVLIFIVAVIIALIQLLGTLLSSAFNLLITVGMFSLMVIIGIVGAIIIWKLLKRGFKEVKEIRAYFKKNKEIEERMRSQAMQK